MKPKKVIYVCTPYSGNPDNLNFAEKCCRVIMKEGNAPLPPHLLYGQFLAEKSERKLGMDCGKALLLRCDEVHVFSQWGISKGMLEEIKFAGDNNIPVVPRDAI